MSPDPTNAERQRRWRERRKAGQIEQVCSCGRRAYGQHAPLCSRCWLKTDVGREWERQRIARLRAARRTQS
jgi:hypothetical protein